MGKLVEDYTKEIKELTDENNKTYDKLEELSVAVINKSIDMMRKQVKQEIDCAVENTPEHTKELNNKGMLKEVKDKTNSTLKNIDDFVKDEFKNDKVFLHRSLKNPDKYKLPYEYCKEVEKKYMEAYRIILGYAGKIICDFGYDKVGNAYNDHSTWKYISGSSEKIRFNCIPDVREVKKEWKDYFDLFKNFVDNAQQITRLTEDKEKTEAVDLWESL